MLDEADMRYPARNKRFVRLMEQNCPLGVTILLIDISLLTCIRNFVTILIRHARMGDAITWVGILKTFYEMPTWGIDLACSLKMGRSGGKVPKISLD